MQLRWALKLLRVPRHQTAFLFSLLHEPGRLTEVLRAYAQTHLKVPSCALRVTPPQVVLQAADSEHGVKRFGHPPGNRLVDASMLIEPETGVKFSDTGSEAVRSGLGLIGALLARSCSIRLLVATTGSSSVIAEWLWPFCPLPTVL